jgi:hypothetical protein
MLISLKAFATNLQDINHVIDEDGNSLMQGFYDMQVSAPQWYETEGSASISAYPVSTQHQ